MRGHSSSSLLFYLVMGRKIIRKNSIKRLRSELHARKAETAPGDVEGCVEGCWLPGLLRDSSTTHLTHRSCFARSPARLAPPHCQGLNRICRLGPGKPPSRASRCQSKKGPDKLCICICIERHFQRHSQGNGLAEYRCYLRMTTIQVILQLHYLSGEISLVCIFTRIISFKSADHICPTLRNEAAQVDSRECFPQRPSPTGTPKPEVTKT